MPGSIVKSPISRLLVLAAAAAGAGAVTAGVVAAPVQQERRVPAVRVVQEHPVVVAGRQFASRERVALRLTVAGRPYSRSLRATASGTFRATIAEADAVCRPYTLTAVGRAGSRATQTRRFEVPPPCGIAPQP